MQTEKLSPREDEKRIAAENGFEITYLSSDGWAKSYKKGKWFMWRCVVRSGGYGTMGWQTAALEAGADGVERFGKHKPFTGDDAMKLAMGRINFENVTDQTWGI